MFQSSNPALREGTFDGWRTTPGMELSAQRSGVMTIQGAVNASLILTGITIASAVASGSFLWSQPKLALIGLIAALVITLPIGIALCFKPLWAQFLAIPYALGEGVFVGLLSAYAASAMAGTKIGGASGSGVIFAASAATFGILAAMLLAYKSNIIRATPLVQKIVVIGMLGACFFGLAVFGARMFGVDTSIVTGNGPLAIAITVVFIVIAAFMLIMDFDMIEQGAASGAPKAMEWYAGYALLVTVVYLYIQILRLIMQLAGRRE